jgi:hypothetical protein
MKNEVEIELIEMILYLANKVDVLMNCINNAYSILGKDQERILGLERIIFSKKTKTEVLTTYENPTKSKEIG